GMDPAARQEAAGQLRQAAEAVQASNPPLAEQLNRAGDALASGDLQSARQALERAAGELDQLDRQMLRVETAEFLDQRLEQGQRELSRFEAIINSMTPQERRDPKLLNANRRRRIAKGSGTTVQDINRFINQFNQMQKMMGGLLKQAGRR
ncbi:MAG TPA: hypothetical protein ENO21_01990, partial [Firmicutes bacterium]|nr:hypothetical protein [Bacillota bacterium]